jgi:hypothetical protein
MIIFYKSKRVFQVEFSLIFTFLKLQSFKIMFKLLILTIYLSVSGVFSHSTGADDISCRDLTPRHGFPPIAPQTSPMPVGITIQPHVINAGDVITVTLQGPIFRGFMIQGRILGSSEVTGSFDSSAGIQRLACSGLPPNSVATHVDSDPKTSVVLRWRAPTNFNSQFIQVNLFYSVVQSYPVFWTNGVSSTTIFINNPSFSMNEN